MIEANADLAILFWFYKDLAICENRLKLLRKYNPRIKIFGLFGGEKKDAPAFKHRLSKYLDDFYASPYTSRAWKWINGDLMITDWHEKKGKFLSWDSIAVTQWDMLLFESIKKLFPKIKRNEVFLSGLRKITKPLEKAWDWTRPGTKERKNYLRFMKYVEKNYGYKETPLACLFILLVFPRVFFEKYLKVKNKQVGMLEYKVPIYARIFGLPFYEKDFGVYWQGNPKTKPLNALPEEISAAHIKGELANKKGWRIFHPYYKQWRL